ncbi:MAG: UDP-N-acetylmuramate--L-alanine ligase [Bacteroidales bacterium]|nr:UDP-N-acetylmuramate--L-alanine ligase [Bacteroidales bacterium]
MSVYFLGIGGIGMSAIARYFLQCGKKVYGYDRTPSPLTDQLQQAGAVLHFDEDITAIPHDVEYVVYTPAVPKSHLEYIYFQEHNIPIHKRSEVLGKLTDGHFTIAVAGTHGKTTTTSMLAHLLDPYRSITAFIGGIAKNFDSNIVIHKDFDTAIVEADEFDRSFLTLHPAIAVITSMDADHLDVYGDRSHLIESFQLFANQVKDTLLIHEKVADLVRHPHKLVYGIGEACDYRISEVKMTPRTARFILTEKNGTPHHFTIGVSGQHNVTNAAAACAIGLLLGLTESQIQCQMEGFSGVKRRFDYQICRDDLVFIDDYAHHPEEIRAIVTAVKRLYADKELTVVFQPHLYTRTRDFGPQFAEVLSLADHVILLDIYPARELPIEGITSQWLLNQISSKSKVLVSKEILVPYLCENRPQVLLTVGAGDIDRLVPEIKNRL